MPFENHLNRTSVPLPLGVRQGQLGDTDAGDKEAASLHWQGQSQFDDFIKPPSSP